MKPSRKQDMQHLHKGYSLLKDAIDEFAMIYYKDSVMANAYRKLGDIEDMIYQAITDNRRAV